MAPVSSPGETDSLPPLPLSPDGSLTAGIAHDFNNLLSVIMVCAGEISDATDDPVQRARAAEIRSAAERGAELARRLLAHERSDRPERQPISLDQSIAADLALVQRTLGAGIRLLAEPDGALPQVALAPGELERILVNLAANARDAMPDGGAVAIRTSLVVIPPGDPCLGTGSWVRLSFSDNGTGMDPEVAHRAVQPFFTTRELTGGTGLGLATVHEIARSCGGDLRINTTPAVGTTVSVYLPALDRNGEPLTLPPWPG